MQRLLAIAAIALLEGSQATQVRTSYQTASPALLANTLQTPVLLAAYSAIKVHTTPQRAATRLVSALIVQPGFTPPHKAVRPVVAVRLENTRAQQGPLHALHAAPVNTSQPQRVH